MPVLRYYQIRFDATRDINVSAFSPPFGPLPSGFTCRALCTPDVATYICSAQKMIYIEPLDYDPVWTGEAGEAFDALSEEDQDELREWWNGELCGVSCDADYYAWSNFIESYHEDGVGFKCAASFMGEEDCDGPHAPDDIREDAQGNHRV